MQIKKIETSIKTIEKVTSITVKRHWFFFKKKETVVTDVEKIRNDVSYVSLKDQLTETRLRKKLTDLDYFDIKISKLKDPNLNPQVSLWVWSIRNNSNLHEEESSAVAKELQEQGHKVYKASNDELVWIKTSLDKFMHEPTADGIIAVK